LGKGNIGKMKSNLLNKFPRHKILPEQTPISKLNRLSAKLGGPTIYVKRDDIDYLGGGGNKLRKLEFFLGAAKASGCDTILAMGGWQSNLTRITAAAALTVGFDCEVVLGRKVPRHDRDYEVNGNLVLERILGIKVHELDGKTDLNAFAEYRKQELEAQGKNVYIIPFGGSSALGCLGYVNCDFEVHEQSKIAGIAFDYVITPNGSSGTQAGLIAGYKILNSSTQVVGYNVLKPIEDVLPVTLELTQNTLDYLGFKQLVERSDILLNDQYLGPGYGQPTDMMRMAVKMVAQKEGLFLDPVYTGKSFSGLIGDIQLGKYKPGQNILFLATGGSPGLYAYQSEF
jgi:L-cysteate sulfo-lyase